MYPWVSLEFDGVTLPQVVLDVCLLEKKLLTFNALKLTQNFRSGIHSMFLHFISARDHCANCATKLTNYGTTGA
jgi:hypothetical protein